MAMFLEVKSLDKHDSFADPLQDMLSKLFGKKHNIFLNNWKFECDTMYGMLMRDQMIEYVLMQIGCQFHQFAFLVAIINKHAHIMCWDCGGAVVMESFNYTEQSWLLGDLFWWCSLASAERMRLDQSVTEVKADFDGQEICTKLKLPLSTKFFYCGVPDDDISYAQRDDPDLTTLYHYIGPHPHFPS
jgi:hypothetical protein